VVYIVHLRGQIEAIRKQVLSQPWVSGIIDGQHNGDSAWQVSVSDPQAAEEQLLKVLVDGPVVVTEFRRKQYELEDIFMQVIEGGQDVRK
jgi:ABC-type uncharacterized transport system ATPase subunit